MVNNVVHPLDKNQNSDYQLVKVIDSTNNAKNHIAHDNLATVVYDYVVRKITTGKYPPQTKISQRTLCEELDVSLVPVREGIEKLKQHGWIKCINRSGTYVRQLSEKEFVKLLQIREMLEAEAVIYLAEHITEKQLAELSGIVDRLVEYSEKDNYNDYEKLDVEFHKKLIEFIENPKLSEYYNSIIMQVRYLFMVAALRVTGFFHEKHPDTLEPANHLRIYMALKIGDREGVEKLIRQHIRTTCEIWKVMNNYYHQGGK